MSSSCFAVTFTNGMPTSVDARLSMNLDDEGRSHCVGCGASSPVWADDRDVLVRWVAEHIREALSRLGVPIDDTIKWRVDKGG